MLHTQRTTMSYVARAENHSYHMYHIKRACHHIIVTHKYSHPLLCAMLWLCVQMRNKRSAMQIETDTGTYAVCISRLVAARLAMEADQISDGVCVGWLT